MRDKIVYFPFAPGIPYRVRNGYILPQMDNNSWNKIFKDKESVFIANKGFVEAVYTLPLIEVLNHKSPGTKLKFISGDFDLVYESQGLAKKTDYSISNEVLNKYPAPVFFNKNKDTAYVNCLNSYINIKDYYGQFKYRDKKAIGGQIFKNIMLDWDNRYTPNLRNLEPSIGMKEFAKARGLNFNHPYILLIPERTKLSKHGASCLGWSVSDVRSFASMISGKGYKLVILTNYPEKYYGINAIISTIKLDFLLYLLVNSNIILSEEVDFLLSALLISNAKIFSKETFDECKIEKNKKFFRAENDICTFKNLSPIDVLGEL